MWQRLINHFVYVFDWQVKDVIRLHRNSRNPVTFMNRLLGDAVYGFFNCPVELKPIKNRIISFKTKIGQQEGWYEFVVMHYRVLRRFERYRFQNLYAFEVRYRGPLDGVSFSKQKNVLTGKKMWQHLSATSGSYYVSRGYDNDYERIATAIGTRRRQEGSGFQDTKIASLSI